MHIQYPDYIDGVVDVKVWTELCERVLSQSEWSLVQMESSTIILDVSVMSDNESYVMCTDRLCTFSIKTNFNHI